MKKELELLTAKEVNDEFSESIPVDRFDLVGVKFTKTPVFPDLFLELSEGTNQPIISLLVDIDIAGEEKFLEFDSTLPVRVLQDCSISVHDIFNEDFFYYESFIENVIRTLLKRSCRIKIERLFPWQDDVEITLTINAYETGIKCKISDLVSFIDQTPESREEYDARQIDEDE
jgi:hypothetical protein